ncbi:MAG: SMI1/KNR4 family protein [Devosia sp.]
MDDWNTIVDRWKSTLRAVERLGGSTSLEAARAADIRHSEVWGLRIDEPASLNDIERVETELGLRLPGSLRDIFQHHSSRIEFCWQLPDDFRRPRILDETFGGRFSLALSEIPRIENDRRIRTEILSELNPDYESAWHSKLAVMDGYPNDFYGFNLKSHVGDELYYLSYNDFEAEFYMLGVDFADFLRRWTAIGCPGPEDWQWMPFTTGPTSLLQPDSEIANIWRRLIGLSGPIAD